ncbi:MAG: GNAT family N-acetyltransferase [Clostridia bacterium]|nr:GNAT family N-acetyltransferase [Clostridia bacterium]
MLCRVDENRFDAVFAVLDASFPPAEKRPYHEQKALLSEPAYTLFAAFDEAGECLGFLATWQLEDVRFIEHFAVAPSRRNQGLGACLLREYLQSSPLPTVLECELPEGELACRRIGFYERNGFVFHDYE